MPRRKMLGNVTASTDAQLQQPFGCLVDCAELRHGEVILVRHRRSSAGDFRRKQQIGFDYAVLRVQRCFASLHCFQSLPPFVYFRRLARLLSSSQRRALSAGLGLG